MCSSVIFMLCAVIISNAFSRENSRDKRQTFELEDRWVWGYYTEKPKEQNTRLVSPNPMDETKKKFTLTSNVQVIESIADSTSALTTTVTPFTSRIETTVPTTTTSPTESVLVKAVTVPSSDIRLLNATTTIQDNVTTIFPPVATTLPTYCKRLVKPNYSIPGRRISVAQCLGYIWELFNRKREADIKPKCGFTYWKAADFIYVIAGRKTEHGEFPHMGAIGWKAAEGTWVFKCGSSLISPKFVLTAAHCSKANPKDFSISDPVPKIVRLGDKKITDKKGYPNSNQYSNPTDRNISRIILHPKYDPPSKYYDIALMELEKPVEFTNLIQPACLWTNFSMGSIRNATLTGWGTIATGGLSVEASPELMAATVDLLDNDHCDELLKNKHNRNWKGFQEHQMCAGKLEGGVDSCQGDSGGPLQVKLKLPKNATDTQGQMHFVVGVISFGIGCAHKNLPGIYTRVSSFIDWIEEIVWKNESVTPKASDSSTQNTPQLTPEV